MNFYTEYDSMMQTLRGNDWQVTDCLGDSIQSRKHEHYATYGAVTNVDGQRVPRETHLTDMNELCFQARYDYILKV